MSFVVKCSPRTVLRDYHEVSFATTGEPMDVLQYHSDPTMDDANVPTSFSSHRADLCRVEMLHVSWNPADVNVVQGRYPRVNHQGGINTSDISWCFPSRRVIGSEGWGRVTRLLRHDQPLGDSKNDRGIQPGSVVTLGISGWGTMRSSLWIPTKDLLSVPSALYDKVGPAGCTLFQLGGTAIRMLTDFVTHSSSPSASSGNEVVIQNAGNSGVGLMTSQLAKTLGGVSVVSLVRRGSKSLNEMEELVDYLTQVGKCDMVVVEDDLLYDKEAIQTLQQTLRELSATQKLPKLALNAVGGPSANLLLKLLDSGGSMVTYGGMSGQGVQVGTPQLIFKDLRVLGYWHSRWMIQHSVDEKQRMIDTLAKAVLDGVVTLPPVQVFSLRDLQQGLKWQSEQSNSVVRSKLVWDCQE
jgi:mitochondrial enoyl-[acyl-carrier protein] reductase / trans-2-enoyl-CoA reductase